MATLPGGQNVTVNVGTNAADQQLANTVLNNVATSAGGPVTVTTSSPTPVIQTPPSNPIQLGDRAVTQIQSVTVGPTAPGQIVQVNVASNASSVTNVSLSGTGGGVVINNTQVGDKVAVFSTNNTGPVAVVGGGSDDYVIAGTGATTVVGGAGQDSFLGGASADSVDGGAGADLLVSGLGADTISGGDDNDTIFGGDGDDSVSGGAGNDILIGEAGNDRLDGGAGRDIFAFGPGSGNDTIVGFNPADDIIGFFGQSVNIAQLISSATVVNGSTVIRLADGTTITVADRTGIDLTWFS